MVWRMGWREWERQQKDEMMRQTRVVALGGGQGQMQDVAEACSDGVDVEVREEGIQDYPSVVAQTGWMMGTFIKMGRLGLWGR